LKQTDAIMSSDPEVAVLEVDCDCLSGFTYFSLTEHDCKSTSGSMIGRGGGPIGHALLRLTDLGQRDRVWELTALSGARSWCETRVFAMGQTTL